MNNVSLSFFECITYSFAMLGSMTAMIPLLGYFKVSIHWVNDFFKENRIISFDWYCLSLIIYHTALLIGTLFILNLNVFEIARIDEKPFNSVFIPLVLIGAGNFITWISVFVRIYKERAGQSWIITQSSDE